VRGGPWSQLIGAVPLARFVAEDWQRRPLSVPGGARAELFSRERLDQALLAISRAPAAGGAETHIRAMFARRGGAAPAGDWMNVFEASPAQVAGLLEAGASICVHDVHACDRELARLAASLKAELGFAGRVGVSAYLSPAGEGLEVHLDAQGVLIVQIEGRKRWRMDDRPVVACPPANALLCQGGTSAWTEPLDPGRWPPPPARDPGSFHEIEMGPGDVLYVPAGTWHATEAITPSLGLAIYFAPITLPTLLENLLWSLFQDRPEWRAGPPVAPLLEETSGALPAAVADYFSARLAELRDALAAIDPGGLALGSLWRRMLVAAPPPEEEPGGAGETDADAPIGEADLLELSDELPVTWGAGVDRDGRPVTCIYRGEDEIGLSGDARAFVAGMMQRRRFRAGASVAWADPARPARWSEVQAVLEELCRRGVLRRAGGDPAPGGEVARDA